jgi:DnaK suppressor protein
MKMTQIDLAAFRQVLEQLRARLRGNVHNLSQEALKSPSGGIGGNLSQVPADPADLGIDQLEQAISLTLLANEGQVLEQIAEALERIEQGAFGICEECDSKIPKARLKALPYTPYCVQCARDVQGSR